MAKIAKYITDPEEFERQYKRVVEMRKELSKRKKELDSIILEFETNKSLPQEVQENLSELKSEAASLSSLLSTTTNYASQIESYYNNWSITKQKIDDEYALSKEQNAEIEALIAKTSDLESQLTAETARSSDLLDKARETLNIVTDASLSSVFSKRSEERRKARQWWTVAVFLAIISFIGAIYYAINHIEVNGVSDWSVWLLRLTLVTPFIYFVYFVTTQYSHERDLEERYAFKSLVAQTLQNYAKLLNDEFVNDNNRDSVQTKILDFTIKSMEGVYNEPHKNTINTEARLRFNPKSAQMEAEAKSVELQK